jgi:hypothetical protein
LKEKGLQVLEDEELERIMTTLRMRYVGGVDTIVGDGFQRLGGIDAILVTTLEYYDPGRPPRFSVISRLVSTGNHPEILWIDSLGLSGLDDPGFLLWGLIGDQNALQNKAFRSLSESLSAYLSGRRLGEDGPRKGESRFRPKDAFRSANLDPGIAYRIAVVPFPNRGERKNAGEILSLHFTQQLMKYNNFRVIEPGVLREKLLAYRIVIGNNLHPNHAATLMDSLDADFLFTGSVSTYEESFGEGAPAVEFNSIIVERRSREVVWHSNSYNSGMEGVYFFEIGRRNTASALASDMTFGVVNSFVGRNR